MKAALALVLVAVVSSCTAVAPKPRPEAPEVRVDGAVVSAPDAPSDGALLAEWLRWRERSGPRAVERLAALHPERALALRNASSEGPLGSDLGAFFASEAGRGWILFQEALRRARAGAGANGTWWRAVELGCTSGDPFGLTEALELRPAGSPWPAGATPADEAAVLVRVAELHLLRSESAEALVAARRAQAAAESGLTRNTAVLLEAQALLALGSRAAALARAAELENSGSEVPRRKALALSGAVHAQGGELELAESMLRRSLEEPAAWPGAGRARADLALVLLARGRTEEGASQLERAKVTLAKESDSAALVRLLSSEAAWHYHLGAHDRAEERLAEARALIRREGLPISL
ncbi:MAG: hypothetical protein GC161_04585 [Planctomycetaceae bacterium]|nr:hypothetical protein [Planctomycetaceae bacterium]